MGERLNGIQEVGGSIPPSSTTSEHPGPEVMKSFLWPLCAVAMLACFEVSKPDEAPPAEPPRSSAPAPTRDEQTGPLSDATGSTPPPTTPLPADEAETAPAEPPQPEPAPPSAPEAPAPGPPPEPVPEPRTAPEPEPEPAPEPVAAPEPPSEEPPAPAFEFDTLEQRLKQTKALGFFTKLELKNRIDDLLDAVREYHARGSGNLSEIREQFDLLVLKVMTLLQDKEAALAAQISRARSDLWAILADPERFAALEAK